MTELTKLKAQVVITSQVCAWIKRYRKVPPEFAYWLEQHGVSEEEIIGLLRDNVHG